MVILIDMDDTIEELMDSWLAYLNRRYGLNVAREDITQWDLTACLPLSDEQIESAIYDPEMWKTVKPKAGAPEVLKRLKDEGHEIYIVTSANYQTLTAKMEDLLFRYFPFLDWHHVIITHNKQMIRGDVLIDDGTHNLLGGSYIPILMDAPHNRSFDEKAHGIRRVHDWEEAYQAICDLIPVK